VSAAASTEAEGDKNTDKVVVTGLRPPRRLGSARPIGQTLDDTQSAINKVGGLSANDAAEAVKPVRDAINTARGARIRKLEPVVLAHEVDAFLVGTNVVAHEVAKTIEKNPWVGWTLTAVGLAAGPAKFAVSTLAMEGASPAIEAVGEMTTRRGFELGHGDAAGEVGGGTAALLTIGVGLGVLGPKGFRTALDKVDNAIFKAMGKLKAPMMEFLLDETGSMRLPGSAGGPRVVQVPGGPKLRNYGGEGGGRGHHVPAKSAFEGAKGYNLDDALAIPDSEMARFGADHRKVSPAQQTLYREFVKTGKALTWSVVQRIETEALVVGGMSRKIAAATVRTAINDMKQSGIRIARTPWGGR
jgi:hypothetical protein